MKTKLLSVGLVSLHLCAWAGGPLCAARQESASSTAPASPQPPPPGDEGFIAHEWGTFTSVQGADGAPLAWRPLITSELPSFVYDRWHSGAPNGAPDTSILLTKSSYMALQRMETPVIYFYSGRAQTVRVDVRFPDGIITEWYPQAASSQPASDDLLRLRGGGVQWPHVQVLPAAAHPELSAALPMDPSASHYFAARGADADFVQCQPNAPSTAPPQTERFLFYRGIGTFKTPLQLRLGATEDDLQLAHQGAAAALKHLFVVQIQQGQGSFQSLPPLSNGAAQGVTLPLGSPALPAAQLQASLGAALRAALVAEGLYPREADAMIATWKASWFGEDGVRVLYLLPRAWTDEILPLTLTPQPKSLVRVMVGRAELITPAMERALSRQVARFGSPDEHVQRQAVADTQAIGLGRFLEPAVRRLTTQNPDQEFNRHAWALLQAAGKPTPKPPAVATR
jgi:hypothetical protein